jgi:POT family proton-dependent oligopeptide transporter
MTISFTGKTFPPAVPQGEHHPTGLPMLFFTEMWERFSYYGMRALLVLYLVNAMGYRRSDALVVYGTYTALVYLTPILGGYLADRYLGYRKAILIGGLVMALGHFAMAFPALLKPALGLIIIGNGFFKPNISTLLGSLYREHDPRRDGGFTIFYIGINLGALLAPLVAGTLGEKIGWHWGFASAGVGMLLAVTQFVRGQHKLGTAGLRAGQDRLDRRAWSHIGLISALMIPLVYAVLGAWRTLTPIWDGIGTEVKVGVPAAAFIAFIAWQHRFCSREEWHRVLAIVIMGVFVICFWMGFEQAGGTMNLFADRLTDRSLLGWEIPASYFQGINPLLIVLLGPVFSAIWTRWDQSRFALPTPAKMGVGILILGTGFIVLAIAQGRAETLGKVGPQWLFFVYLLHTIGELCLSPIGLSMVTKLAPVRLAAIMMGIWFTANAIANYLAGILESLLASSTIPLYWFLVGSSFGAGALLLMITPLLKYLMHGKG